MSYSEVDMLICRFENDQMQFEQQHVSGWVFRLQTEGKQFFCSLYFLPHLKRVLFQERGTDAVTDTDIQQVFHGLSCSHIWQQGK